MRKGERRIRGVGTALAALAMVATVHGGAARADDETFVLGMTVAFAGRGAVEIRLRAPRPMPVKTLWSGASEGQMLPLDLWLLKTDGGRLAATGARLVDPDGRATSPKDAGHWRVERPVGGVWRLRVPPSGRPWRLWSAFHPFKVKVDRPTALRVRGRGAVFLENPGRRTFAVRVRAASGSVAARLRDRAEAAGPSARLNSRWRSLAGRKTPGPWRLDLEGEGEIELAIEGIRPWAAFLPWDRFDPGAPCVRIEAETRPGLNALLDLRAVASDPDGDIALIVWEVDGAGRHKGARLRLPLQRLDAFSVRATVRDRRGAADTASVRVKPCPPHVRKPEGTVLMQAEGFKKSGGRTVLVIASKQSYVSGGYVTRWGRKGQWLEWSFVLPREGRYEVYARYGTTFGAARRRVLLDGKVPAKPYEEVSLPPTGGYGRGPSQWSVVKLGPPLPLSAGPHRLRMVVDRGGRPDAVALDYVALVPVRPEP